MAGGAVRHYIAGWRALLPSPLRGRRKNEAPNYPVPLVVPSPRRATWLSLGRAGELEEEHRGFVERFLETCPEDVSGRKVSLLLPRFIASLSNGGFPFQPTRRSFSPHGVKASHPDAPARMKQAASCLV